MAFRTIYIPVLNWAVAIKLVLAGAACLVVMDPPLRRLLGTVSPAQLERELWIRATLPRPSRGSEGKPRHQMAG